MGMKGLRGAGNFLGLRGGQCLTKAQKKIQIFSIFAFLQLLPVALTRSQLHQRPRTELLSRR